LGAGEGSVSEVKVEQVEEGVVEVCDGRRLVVQLDGDGIDGRRNFCDNLTPIGVDGNPAHGGDLDVCVFLLIVCKHQGRHGLDFQVHDGIGDDPREIGGYGVAAPVEVRSEAALESDDGGSLTCVVFVCGEHEEFGVQLRVVLNGADV